MESTRKLAVPTLDCARTSLLKVTCCSSLCSVLGTPFYVMKYARGRLFKDPSLPGMTAEERKVRVESVRRGGGREGAHSIHFQNKYSGTKGRGTGKISSLQRTFVT